MSDAQTELKRCPFCGGEGEMSYYHRPKGTEPAGHFIECTTCAASGESVEIQGEMPDRVEYTKAKAIAAWNTRAPAPTEKGDGVVVVPREPTSEMVDAAVKEVGNVCGWEVKTIYRAMIAATQQATGEGELRREIERLKAALIEAQTLDKGFYDWLVERDLIDTGGEIEWPDIVTALTEHEIEVGRADQQAVSPPEGVGWRPIETHDGSEFYVLIADAEGNVVEARLLDDGRGWWARNNDPTDHWGEEWFPTHWMPKPLAPARPHRNAADGGSSNEVG